MVVIIVGVFGALAGTLVPVVVFFAGVVMVLFEVVSSCVFLSIAVGVFLAGVFEGVGGRGWTARCCLGVSHKREAEPAQQCRPPGSWGRYTATAGPRAPPTLFFFFSEHQCLSQAGVHTDLYN